MKYFNTLPLVAQPDNNGNYILVNNIVTRGYLTPSLAKNVMLFYQYDIRDADTPENIAYKYYNDQNRYWLILYSNNVMDPVWDWILPNQVFHAYIDSKYAAEAANAALPPLAYTKTTPHHYEKIITISTDDFAGTQKQVTRIQIDANTYTNLIPKTTTRNQPTGGTVTQVIDKNIVTIYDYEVETNESKRTIDLMKDYYAADAEKQLATLMA